MSRRALHLFVESLVIMLIVFFIIPITYLNQLLGAQVALTPWPLGASAHSLPSPLLVQTTAADRFESQISPSHREAAVPHARARPRSAWWTICELPLELYFHPTLLAWLWFVIRLLVVLFFSPLILLSAIMCHICMSTCSLARTRECSL